MARLLDYGSARGLVILSMVMGMTGCVADGTKEDDTTSATTATTSGDGGMGGAGGGATATGGGGAELGVEWQCIGDVKWPPLEKDMLRVQLTLKEYLSGESLVGKTVKACANADAECLSPIATAVSDEGAIAVLMVPADGDGWTGYFEVTGDGLPTNLLPIIKPFTNDPTFDVAIVSTDTLGTMAKALGNITLDPERGHAGIDMHDCLFQLAPHTMVEPDHFDDKSTLAYFMGDLPKKTLTETTDTGGVAVANIPPGNVTFKAYVNPGKVEFAEVKAPIRAGAVTLFSIEPTP